MTSLTASQTRIPPDAFNSVVYKGDRVRITRQGVGAVYLVSEEDVQLMEMIEDLIDIQHAREALADMKAKGEKPIPWEDVKASMGL